MTALVHHLANQFRQLQAAIWGLYLLLAAVMLRACRVRPILKYLRSSSGIGDACIRMEAIQRRG